MMTIYIGSDSSIILNIQGIDIYLNENVIHYSIYFITSIIFNLIRNT